VTVDSVVDAIDTLADVAGHDRQVGIGTTSVLRRALPSV